MGKKRESVENRITTFSFSSLSGGAVVTPPVVPCSPLPFALHAVRARQQAPASTMARKIRHCFWGTSMGKKRESVENRIAENAAGTATAEKAVAVPAVLFNSIAVILL